MKQTNKNTYFISDIHLGAPDFESSRKREKMLVEWMEQIKDNAEAIYFAGDIFDFWYEWKHVVPKGAVRFLAKTAELVERGVDIHFFTGNHDVWMFGYFEKEIGVKVHHDILRTQIEGKKFYIGHGDALGPNDIVFKTIKKIFKNKTLQWLFSRIHPNFAIGLANAWSKKSRKSHKENYHGEEKEWLVMHAREVLKKDFYHYFIFGHRHIPMIYHLNGNSIYINTGDWLQYFSYIVFDGKKAEIKYFRKNT